MKKFLQHWLGINDLHELHLLNKSRMNDHKITINDLKDRTQFLENDVRMLLAVIKAIFPHYQLVYKELLELDKVSNLSKQLGIDMTSMKYIQDLRDIHRENIENYINMNNIDLTEIVEKQIDNRLYGLIDKRFNELIELRFPIPEEYTEDKPLGDVFKDIDDALNRLFKPFLPMSNEPVKPGESENN